MNEKPTIMDEKPSISKGSEPEMADPAGRRQSVALNIVENPLKVRFSFSAII